MSEREERVEELLGGCSAIHKADKRLSQGNRQREFAFAHGVAEFLLVAQTLGVEFHCSARITHLQKQIALILKRFNQVFKRFLRFFLAALIKHGGV